MEVGKKYNWVNQPERLIYLGHNFSSNGYWHQFALVDKPEVVWCELLESEIHCIEETIPELVEGTRDSLDKLTIRSE